MMSVRLHPLWTLAVLFELTFWDKQFVCCNAWEVGNSVMFFFKYMDM